MKLLFTFFLLLCSLLSGRSNAASMPSGGGLHLVKAGHADAGPSGGFVFSKDHKQGGHNSHQTGIEDNEDEDISRKQVALFHSIVAFTYAFIFDPLFEAKQERIPFICFSATTGTPRYITLRVIKV